MFFRKRIARSCSYCSLGTKLEDGQILCSRKGIKDPGGKCRKFVYDPCKRIPPKPKALDFEKYDQEDYSL